MDCRTRPRGHRQEGMNEVEQADAVLGEPPHGNHAARQDVIRRIVERDQQQLELNEYAVTREEAELHALACETFGSWEIALYYAGVNAKIAARRRTYSPEEVIREIYRMCSDCNNVTSRRISSRRRRLYDAAIQHFGTWQQALCAAGVDPKHIRPYPPDRRPNKQQVIDGIVRRRELGLSLRWVDAARDNHAFAVHAKHMFGCWRDAVLAAGASTAEKKPASVGMQPSCSDAPLDSHEAGSDAEGNEAPTLVQEMAGKRRQKWTKERILADIQCWHRQGLSLSSTIVYRPLVRAATRYFGGWPNAVAAAGLVPPGSGRLPKRRT